VKFGDLEILIAASGAECWQEREEAKDQEQPGLIRFDLVGGGELQIADVRLLILRNRYEPGGRIYGECITASVVSQKWVAFLGGRGNRPDRSPIGQMEGA
jgi:hypothetical protein